MAYNTIIFKIRENIATITFNRPEILNALNEEALKEFSNALDEVNANEDIRVLILTGAGEKSFIAGADIKQFLTFNTLKAKSFSEMRLVEDVRLHLHVILYMHLKTQCSGCRR